LDGTDSGMQALTSRLSGEKYFIGGGGFPVTMVEGMLPSLTTLRLDDNLFTGSLPNEID